MSSELLTIIGTIVSLLGSAWGAGKVFSNRRRSARRDRILKVLEAQPPYRVLPADYIQNEIRRQEVVFRIPIKRRYEPHSLWTRLQASYYEWAFVPSEDVVLDLLRELRENGIVEYDQYHPGWRLAQVDNSAPSSRYR
jgi:hypothetical protein